MDDMDKMCDKHPWCTTKTIDIQKKLDFSLGVLLGLVICNIQ